MSKLFFKLLGTAIVLFCFYKFYEAIAAGLDPLK
jgi:hypothetical protein